MMANLQEFLSEWHLEQDDRRLRRYFFLQDYQKAHEFLGEVVRVDSLSHKNCPSYRVTQGDLLVLDLYSPSLDGLS